MSVLPVPPAKLDCVAHADWIELEALQSADGVCSLNSFAAQIRISGSAEVLTDPEDDDPHDRGGEQSDAVASDAWAEIERRYEYCGKENGAYPFDVSASSIVLQEDGERSVYVFQVLLSKYGHDAVSGMHADRMFEQISGTAAVNYFGGEANSAELRCFGFPREDRTGFPHALQELCKDLNASRVKLDDPRIGQQKDSHLDIVVWRPFLDRRASQLIGFGQCATEKNWNNSKLMELQPRSFTAKWLHEDFYPDPIRMYFLPRCIKNDDWRNAAIDGGVLFDRCRISELIGQPSLELVTQYAAWSSNVLSELRNES